MKTILYAQVDTSDGEYDKEYYKHAFPFMLIQQKNNIYLRLFGKHHGYKNMVYDCNNTVVLI